MSMKGEQEYIALLAKYRPYQSKYDPPIKFDADEYFKMFPMERCNNEPIL